MEIIDKESAVDIIKEELNSMYSYLVIQEILEAMGFSHYKVREQ